MYSITSLHSKYPSNSSQFFLDLKLTKLWFSLVKSKKEAMPLNKLLFSTMVKEISNWALTIRLMSKCKELLLYWVIVVKLSKYRLGLSKLAKFQKQSNLRFIMVWPLKSSYLLPAEVHQLGPKRFAIWTQLVMKKTK